MNLSKVVGHFVEEQKTMNAQTTQKIEMLEGTFNKRLDDLQCSVSRLVSQKQIQEKEKSPSQKKPIPSGVHEEGFYSNLNSKLNEVKAIITLRSGKELTKPSPKAIDPEQEAIDTAPRGVVIKQTVEEYKPPPPFPQSLRTKKKAINQVEILEVLRQVKVNIPLLDMIKQVPTYAKFLKDLCTVKKGLNNDKKAFLIEQVSAIIQCKTLVKYKDPGCPTISVNIGGIDVEKALLDLGASVNLLPYSMYRQLGLGELKPTSITLSVTDRSIKIPKGNSGGCTDSSGQILLSNRFCSTRHRTSSSRGQLCTYHLGKTILGHLQCSYQLQEWCHATHLRKHDFRAQHLPSE